MAAKAATLFVILLRCISASLRSVRSEDVVVFVRGDSPIGTTDDNFICATLDWWPEKKCDFGQCPWGNSGLNNLNLSNGILANAIKAFNPLRIRIGGSLQDQVVYNVGNTVKKCHQFKENKSGLFGFSKGCLRMERWDQLNEFFNKTNAKITFGLNALYGKKKPSNNGTLWVGDWDSSNARALINHTVSKGYSIDSWELGNELSSPPVVGARIESKQYARDIIELKNLVKKLYADAPTPPKVNGPAGFYEKTWFDTFLKISGPHVVDGLSHHVYNLGSGADPAVIRRVQDPHYLDGAAQIFRDVATSVKQFGPWAGAWVGEAGGAYTSGSQVVSHTFANGFWYLDQLGMTSTFNHKVYCRQTLIGGNYGLLNTTTFVPNPDYYGALLWHRLMGKTVLSASQNVSAYLRVYCHCSKQKGITLIMINLSNSSSFNVSVANGMNPNQTLLRDENASDVQAREEYHLTPNDNILSDVVLLNRTPLKLTKFKDIPELKPVLVNGSSPITVAPQSIVFATIGDFNATACA